MATFLFIFIDKREYFPTMEVNVLRLPDVNKSFSFLNGHIFCRVLLNIPNLATMSTNSL